MMALVRIVLLAVVAYFAYQRWGWQGAAGVVIAYIALYLILGAIGRALSSRRSERQTAQLINTKLSDGEKAHLDATQAHEQAMVDHKAQFDPELRKSRGQQS